VWLPLSIVGIFFAVNDDASLGWPPHLLLTPFFVMAAVVFCLLSVSFVAYMRDIDWQWNSAEALRASGATCIGCFLCALITLSITLLALKLSEVWEGGLIEVAAPFVVVLGVAVLAIVAATVVFWRSRLRNDVLHSQVERGLAPKLPSDDVLQVHTTGSDALV
jgi:amino acid transporter